jgi:pimeloyl-ACP methyl ester carboxylesterase
MKYQTADITGDPTIAARLNFSPAASVRDGLKARPRNNPTPAFRNCFFAGVSAVALALMAAGCAAPIGADRVSTRQAYAQRDANALRTGKPSAATEVILRRYDLDRLAARRPDEAVRLLHRQALETGERDLLFALSELSYVAGNRIRQSVKRGDQRDDRDYYLGSAVYAWLYLFGDGKDPKPDAFEPRFRLACEFYNNSLGLALITERRSTNAFVRLENAHRRLPVGAIDLQLNTTRAPERLDEFEQILLADGFRVRGLSVRNRTAGIGAPLLCVKPLNPGFGVRQSLPATVVLHAPASLAELVSGSPSCSLELYSGFDAGTVAIGRMQVPLERDLTTFRAYTLSQSTIWKLGTLQFLAPAERFPSQLIVNQPYKPGLIPVVFVHGTFSSPVTWAEMANTLVADPVLREHYQIWSFVYGSGNPLVRSFGEFREALSARVRELDPTGTNAALRQMVIIGHSQGGLLTKATAIHSGDAIWRTVSTNRLEDLNISDADREKLRRLVFLEPLPFVKRVVFIATPHRGSYLAASFARGLAQRLVSLPRAVVSRREDVDKITSGSEMGNFFGGRIPTSLDGMSPKNPGLLAMAEIPVVPEIKAHSIIPVCGQGDFRTGRDGVVSYQSAHVDNVESEFIVRSVHSCQNEPATIEEVRRILRQHLTELRLNPK